MKKSICLAGTIVIFTGVVFSPLFRLDAQWRQTEGTDGSSIRSLVVDGNNLLAGTSGGIFRSSDNGATWTSSGSGLNDTSITSLVKSGNKLYASTLYNGLFFSTNGGTNWIAINDSSLGGPAEMSILLLLLGTPSLWGYRTRW